MVIEKKPWTIAIPSFPRRRESSAVLSKWIPAYAGMTIMILALIPKPLIADIGQIQQFQKLQEQQPVDERFFDTYQKLIQNPIDPKLHVQLGYAYLEQEMFETAITAFRRALNLNTHLAPAYIGLSKTYRKKQLKQHELNALKKAVSLDPENAEYHYQLGVLLMEPATFNYAQAKRQYKNLLKLNLELAKRLNTLMQSGL